MGTGQTKHIICNIPMDINYTTNEHTGSDGKVRVYPTITKIEVDKRDLSDIIDSVVTDRLRNLIFRDLNKDIYG